MKVGAKGKKKKGFNDVAVDADRVDIFCFFVDGNEKWCCYIWIFSIDNLMNRKTENSVCGIKCTSWISLLLSKFPTDN